jgi:hypothetical protein
MNAVPATSTGMFDGVGYANQYVSGPNFSDTGSTQAISPVLAASSMSSLPLPGNYHVQFPGPFADVGQAFGLGSSVTGGASKKKKTNRKKRTVRMIK